MHLKASLLKVSHFRYVSTTFKMKFLNSEFKPLINFSLQKHLSPLTINFMAYSTVFALSSGHGKCGVAVIRITGENAKECIWRMTSIKKLPNPRKCVLRHIVDTNSGEILDKGLVLWFPAPKSFTGEDCVELHVHGGSAVCKAVLSSLGRLPDFSPAQPGDFTKRAFYNGKLDLTSIEGLGDLIHAETEAQRKQAFKQMEGSLEKVYFSWRELILKCRANIEAYIDFSEDDNIEQDVLVDARRNLERLVKEVSNHLLDSRKGERVRMGLNLAILGRPNVGKSSFLNTLVQRPAAIVSPIAGTTRDVVKVSLDLGGYPVNISDTAGLRSSTDVIEREGIRRAINEVKHADIALVIVEASEFSNYVENTKNDFNLETFLYNYFSEVRLLGDESLSEHNYEWLSNESYLILFNKIDLLEPMRKKQLFKLFSENPKIAFSSLKTLEGLEIILNKMKILCEKLCGSSGQAENPYLTSQRQKTHIEECLKHLVAILGKSIQEVLTGNLDCNDDGETSLKNLLNHEETLVIAAQRLQLASNQLGYVTGHITTEDVLDKIFSSFCIGK